MARKITSTPKIAPEGGWELHSRYGALKDAQGNPLEHLEAVHALLMKRDGLTSVEAAVRVFGPFVADANSELGMMHGAVALRRHLQIVDPSDKAIAVDSQSGRAHVERVAELFPYVPHHHFERGTQEAFYYALGVVAGEAWSPSRCNLDLNDRLDGCCAEGDFPSIEKAREILGPFAVRHELAHKLWGWGDVANVVTLQAVSSSLTADAIKDGAGKNKRNEWSQEARAVMKAAFEAGKLSGERIEDVAVRFGLTRQAFTGVVNRDTKGTRSKTGATPAQKQATR